MPISIIIVAVVPVTSMALIAAIIVLRARPEDLPAIARAFADWWRRPRT